mgnify:CR=1 FL=1
MADIIKTATREAWGKALVELGEKNKSVVVLDADLSAATKTGSFKKAFPDRFFNTGIAECNMMGIAAGLAATGITEVEDIHHIERGYDNLERKLQLLGADIVKKSFPGASVKKAL